MGNLVEALRGGSWLTRERLRLVAWTLLAASLLGLLYLAATSDGLNDRLGRPLGTDFANVYAAGTYVREGRADAPFDPQAQYARERALFGPATPFYGWHYPPFFLFVAAALAGLPYILALAVWQSATLGLYLLSLRAILAAPFSGQRKAKAAAADPLWLLLALAFPAVFINIGHGHNGFLTAALFGFALVLLDRRPLLAGLLFGLLAYKPQFGLMIPLVLIATGRWRVFAAASVTVASLVFATWAAFGPQVWEAFSASTRFTRLVVLEDGNTGWHKIQSVFAWARLWGAPVALAYAMQGLATIAAAAALVRLWRSAAAFALKAAALLLAAIIATPYSLDYDMMVLAPAIAFFAADGSARGFKFYEKTALAALWLTPLLARSVAEHTLVPLGPMMLLAGFVLVLRRARSDPAEQRLSLRAAR